MATLQVTDILKTLELFHKAAKSPSKKYFLLFDCLYRACQIELAKEQKAREEVENGKDSSCE